MKRDMDLIRALLLQFEKATDQVDATRLTIPNFSRDEIIYHTQLLSEAGLIRAHLYADDSSYLPQIAQVDRLTWEGHEFLDAARDDSTWQKAKETVLSKLGTVSLAVFQSLLISIAKSQLNLQ